MKNYPSQNFDFKPWEDQTNVTSKNDLKRYPGALNRKKFLFQSGNITLIAGDLARMGNLFSPLGGGDLARNQRYMHYDDRNSNWYAHKWAYIYSIIFFKTKADITGVIWSKK